MTYERTLPMTNSQLSARTGTGCSTPAPLPQTAGASPLPLPAQAVDDLVSAALAEDAPWGDLTSHALIPEETAATAFLTAREEGIFCGEQVIEAAFRLAGPGTAVISWSGTGIGSTQEASWLKLPGRPGRYSPLNGWH